MTVIDNDLIYTPRTVLVFRETYVITRNNDAGLSFRKLYGFFKIRDKPSVPVLIIKDIVRVDQHVSFFVNTFEEPYVFDRGIVPVVP